MITLTRKKYEIEEPIQIKGEDGSLLVDYIMKITPEEKLEIRDLIFDKQDVKDGRLMSKLESEKNIDEVEQLEEKILERAKARQEKFENIVYKEQREIIKSKVGEYLYLDLVDSVFNFFVEAFVDKKAAQINTITTSLRKITGK